MLMFHINFQTITVILEENLPERVLLSTDDKTLEGISVFRIEFKNVTGVNSAVVQLRILGCAEGKMTIPTFP